MQINLIAVGKKMPTWVETAYQDYAKRLPTDFKLNLIEIAAIKRTKNINVEQLLIKEGEQLLANVAPGQCLIALDVKGQTWSTEQLAEKMQQWHDDARDISLLIGGPEGLSKESLQKAELRWSLSPLTFPHPLVRVILAEQLYRAWTILKNHPYHRI